MIGRQVIEPGDTVEGIAFDGVAVIGRVTAWRMLDRARLLVVAGPAGEVVVPIVIGARATAEQARGW